MKPRTVIILWIIAIILGVSVFFVKKSASGEDKNATNRTPGQTLLADFAADKAASIEITGAEQSATLALKDGKWTVAERDNFPANSRNINDLLRTLAELKISQAIEAGPSFAPRFGMDENSTSAETRGLTAVFKDASGKELAKVSFGKNLDAAASNSPFGGGATGRFVRNHADDSGFYAVSEVFGTLTEDPKSWLSDDFIKVEKIKGISVTKPGSDENEWEFTRADESADFAFTEAYPGVKTDAAATTPLKSLFSFSRFDDVVPAAEVEKKATPEKLQKAVITTFEGFTYRITLQPVKPAAAKDGEEAPPASDNYLMTVAVEAELAKERKKPENEKPEDAEAAQKIFDDRLKALNDNLEKTKALEGRTFEVSKYTVDALLKNRTEFMDKGPGPEAAAPPIPEGISAFTPPVEIPAQPAPEEAPPEEAPPAQPAPEEAPPAQPAPEEAPSE
jgi:hypothetical protein